MNRYRMKLQKIIVKIDRKEKARICRKMATVERVR